MLDTAVQYNLCKTATPKKTKHWFSLMQDKSIAECSKGEHYVILSNFIKLPFVIKIFILSIFESPFYKGFTVPWINFGKKYFVNDRIFMATCRTTLS